jgi:mannose/fructose/N-acetylgalactosamine-specific phosphotransferase system component IID
MLKEAIDRAASEAAHGALRGINTGLMGAWMGIGTVLAVRLILLLTLCGAFVLAMMAMGKESYYFLGVFVAYSLLIVLPMVYLSRFGKGGGNAG